MIAKLCRVQAALKAPKNQRNNFGNYNYRSCEDILEAVKPLLAKEGLVLTISDSIEMIGTRIYVKATATLTDGEKEITTSAYAREADVKKGMDESQITGAASSYARKYTLNGLFCIDDCKDADTMDNTPPKSAPKKAKSNDKKSDALAIVKKEMARLHISAEDISEILPKQYGKKKWADLTDAEAADMAKNVGNYAVELMGGVANIVNDDDKLMEGI